MSLPRFSGVGKTPEIGPKGTKVFFSSLLIVFFPFMVFFSLLSVGLAFTGENRSWILPRGDGLWGPIATVKFLAGFDSQLIRYGIATAAWLLLRLGGSFYGRCRAVGDGGSVLIHRHFHFTRCHLRHFFFYSSSLVEEGGLSFYSSLLLLLPPLPETMKDKCVHLVQKPDRHWEKKYHTRQPRGGWLHYEPVAVGRLPRFLSPLFEV